MICVTNDVDDLRSCTYRGAHTDECNGFTYERVWDSRWEYFVQKPTPCLGCEPRKALVGFVCRGCFEGVTSALAGAPRLIASIAGLDRVKVVDTDGRSSSSPGYVPLPATRLAVDELERYLALVGTASADILVSNSFTAETAVKFARAYAAAVRSFPLKEESHPLQRTWCPDCEQLTLVWYPPAFNNMDVFVSCRDPKCGRVIDQASFEGLAALEAGTITEGATFTPPWADSPKAEVFDPDNPEHLALIGEA